MLKQMDFFSLRISIRLNNRLPIDSLTNSLKELIMKLPFIYECSISVFMETQVPTEIIKQLLNILEKTKFGVSVKVPKVYLFIPIKYSQATMVDAYRQFNTINDFLHVILVVDTEDQDDVEDGLLETNQLLSENYISHSILCAAKNSVLYPKMLNDLLRIKTLLFSKEIFVGVYIKEISQRAWDYANVLNTYPLIQKSLDFIPLLPRGYFDILYCLKQLLSNQAGEKDVTKMSRRLTKLISLFKNNYLEFNNNSALFTPMPLLLYQEGTVKYIVENLANPINDHNTKTSVVKVRSCMADYI